MKTINILMGVQKKICNGKNFEIPPHSFDENLQIFNGSVAICVY